MKKQKGVSLSGLMFWGVIVAMIALVVIKVAPSAIEYWKIRKGVGEAEKSATDIAQGNYTSENTPTGNENNPDTDICRARTK